uniref:hypothetical protein n=1 Tax=Salmonella enterica TaxID=28901 RepID=UPI00207CBC54|nr:hypothetical protein [Salmonella enterica]
MYDNTHQQAKRYAEIATQAIMSSLGYKMGMSRFNVRLTCKVMPCSLKSSVVSRQV